MYKTYESVNIANYVAIGHALSMKMSIHQFQVQDPHCRTLFYKKFENDFIGIQAFDVRC